MDRLNRPYADRRQNFADSGALQFALREVQALLGRPGFWIVLAAAVAILVVTGPAGTLARYDAPERLAYWGLLALATFLTGLFATIFFVRLIAPRVGARIPALAIGALLAAIPITLEVWLVGLLFPDAPSSTLAGVAALYGTCFVITAAVAAIYDVSSPRAAHEAALPAPPTTEEAPFLKRIAPRLGKDLISLQAQDHYLDVTTRKGHELILMRLSDAEGELADYPGMRIHRSWWVARSAVEGVDTAGDKISVRLVNGTVAPVSRAKRAELRKWLASSGDA